MTKFWVSVDIHDIITCANFCDNRLRGCGVARGRISRFPIDLRRRPYNTRTTMIRESGRQRRQGRCKMGGIVPVFSIVWSLEGVVSSSTEPRPETNSSSSTISSSSYNSCARGDTIFLRPCKLTISSHLFARWHL